MKEEQTNNVIKKIIKYVYLVEYRRDHREVKVKIQGNHKNDQIMHDTLPGEVKKEKGKETLQLLK